MIKITKEQSQNFDFLKYIMSILIILLHVGYGYVPEMAFLKTAVPIYFILSSFFFFNKISASQESEHRKILGNTVKRIAILYLFWFIVFLPFTIYANKWYTMSLGEFIERFSIELFINGTFPASWFLSALLIGSVIIFLLRKHNTIALLISLFAYLFCCFLSSYYFQNQAILSTSAEIELFRHWGAWDCVLFRSFLAGLYFIFMGKIFAERGFLNMWLSFGLAILGLCMLYIENSFIYSIGYPRSNDCLVSLMLFAPAFVSTIANIKKTFTSIKTVNLRKASTIIYCSHYAFVITILCTLSLSPITIFAIVFTFCSILAYILIKLSQKPRFKILKYSY